MNPNKYEYYIEYRKSDEPDVWLRQFESCGSLEYAKHLLNNYLERCKGGSLPFHDGTFPLGYRIVEIKIQSTENILETATVEYPEYDADNSDELYYLKQSYKYLKHLEYTYKVRLKNVRKAWDINASLLHIENRIKELQNKVKVDYSEQWRTFDQS